MSIQPENSTHVAHTASARRRALVRCAVGLYLLLATIIAGIDIENSLLRAVGLALLLGVILLIDGGARLMLDWSLLDILPENFERTVWVAAVLFQLLFTGREPAIGWIGALLGTAWPLLALIGAPTLALILVLSGKARRARWLLALQKAAGAILTKLIAQARLLAVSSEGTSAAVRKAPTWDSLRAIDRRELAGAFKRNLLQRFTLAAAVRPALLLAAILLSLWSMSDGMDGTMHRPLVTMLGWGGSIGLVVWAGWKPVSRASSILWRVCLTAGGLFVLALLARMTFLSSIPVELTGDEARFGSPASIISSERSATRSPCRFSSTPVCSASPNPGSSACLGRPKWRCACSRRSSEPLPYRLST